MKQALSSEQQQLLRNNKVIEQSEIVYQEGDLFIAEDVLSNTKRILNAAQILSESNKKQVLLD